MSRSFPLTIGRNARVGVGPLSRVVLDENPDREEAYISVWAEATVWFSFGSGPAVVGQGFKMVKADSPLRITHGRSVSMITETAGGANEKQKITISGAKEAAGSKFTIGFEGESTGEITYKAALTKEELKTALEEIEALEENIAVTGEAGGPWTVEFKEGLKAMDVDTLTVDISKLKPEGEEEVEATVETTVPGGLDVTFAEA